MKAIHFILFLFLFSSFHQVNAQIPQPEDYYDSAEGLTGYELKTALKNIINNHTVHSYGSLWNFYSLTDADFYYDHDGTVLMMYTENPNGADPYTFTFDEVHRCGGNSPTFEGQCWNREHVFPQGFFNSLLPMRTDLHHVIPSDGYVNNSRGNSPFGPVSNATYTSFNGTKFGGCNVSGHSGTCFEPLDEFKGDIARIFLYFATRYENEVTSSQWKDPAIDNNNPLNGTNDQVYKDWQIDVFLEWHALDPVSQKEIDRNNFVYQIQGNRNPFVDYPEWAYTIWRPEMKTKDFAENVAVSVYPNPTKDVLHLKSDKTIDRVEVYALDGRIVKAADTKNKNPQINVSSLPSGIYLLRMQVNGKWITEKFVKD